MKTKSLPPERWIEALLSPQNEIVFDLVGFPLFFEAAPGWVVGPQRITSHLFYFCRSGSVRTTVGANEFLLQAGAIAVIRPGAHFTLRLPPGGTASLARFRLSIRNPAGAALLLPDACIHLRETGTARAWLDLVRPQLALRAPWGGAGLRAVLAGFFAAAFAADAEATLDRHAIRGRLSATQIGALENFVEQRGAVATKVADLAAHLRLSHDYFNRLFLATFQRSARDWLIEHRVRAAAQRLVESTKNISEVADEFGYTSVYFFSRQFRQVMGSTPTGYRSQHATNSTAPS